MLKLESLHTRPAWHSSLTNDIFNQELIYCRAIYHRSTSDDFIPL